MSTFEIIIILMAFGTLLVGIAQRLHMPYPIALVIGGGILGFTPGFTGFAFHPQLILVVTLPPILYYGAFHIPIREFKRNWMDICSLALGLVIATTLAIGVLFKWLFPELPWALAFAVGAVVSPPDAAAATTILRRFAISHRTLIILEGESLVNDASALVLYKMAVVALLSGVFSLADASMAFVIMTGGGLFFGFVMGLMMQYFSRRYLEPIVGVLFSLTVPYITYIMADAIGVSGVLAVVVNGLIGAHLLVSQQSSLRRVLGVPAWDILIILLNCFVFILLGMQLGAVTDNMTYEHMARYTGYGALITLLMTVVRFGWVFFRRGMAYLSVRHEHKRSAHANTMLRDATIMGWSGMRGIVSLIAALALPTELLDGSPLLGRQEAVYIIFVVIMFTLLIPGLTLPILLRYLGVNQNTQTEDRTHIRAVLSMVADEELHRLHEEEKLTDEEEGFLVGYFSARHRVLDFASGGPVGHKLEMARVQVIQAQREKLVQLWKIGEVDDRLVRTVERELDVEEAHTIRAEIR